MKKNISLSTKSEIPEWFIYFTKYSIVIAGYTTPQAILLLISIYVSSD